MAQNFHAGNLLRSSGLQPLQVFARNYLPAAVAQLKNQQIQPRSRPIFYSGNARLILQCTGALDGAINLGVGSDDLVLG